MLAAMHCVCGYCRRADCECHFSCRWPAAMCSFLPTATSPPGVVEERPAVVLYLLGLDRLQLSSPAHIDWNFRKSYAQLCSVTTLRVLESPLTRAFQRALSLVQKQSHSGSSVSMGQLTGGDQREMKRRRRELLRSRVPLPSLERSVAWALHPQLSVW